MLIDAGFEYTSDLLHNMDKFQKLLEIEREQCAKLCETNEVEGQGNWCCPSNWDYANEACAAAIRARGQS
jgi:hypothetical protein